MQVASSQDSCEFQGQGHGGAAASSPVCSRPAGGPGRASPVSSSKEMRPPDQEGGGSDTGTGRGLKIALEGQCQDKSLRETFHD